MAGQNDRPLNRLERELPEGLLVDTAWLKQRGYSRQLLNHYVGAGWLEQPARGVYRRPRGHVSWQRTIISLQSLLEYPLAVGGRTALELQGYAHYLRQGTEAVHLYGPKAPPAWLKKLPLRTLFIHHNSLKLFQERPTGTAKGDKASHDAGDSLTVQNWGQWDWPLTMSTPERALLELLDELPAHESFHQADVLMESLSSLSPRRLQELLVRCRSVKVKRLFFFFADRHHHAWLKRLDRRSINLGSGKRMLVKGGRFDPVHQITVPEDLDAVQ